MERIRIRQKRGDVRIHESFCRGRTSVQADDVVRIRIISHLTADFIFHPPVFYFTGTDIGKTGEAMIRHLYFESELDRIIRWIFPRIKKPAC